MRYSTASVTWLDGKVIFDGDVEEAINLYLQRSDTSRVLSMDLSKEKRPNWLIRHNVKLLSASFLNKSFASFVDIRQMSERYILT